MNLKGTASSMFQTSPMRKTDEQSLAVAKPNITFQTVNDITVPQETTGQEPKELPEREIKDMARIIYKSV